MSSAEQNLGTFDAVAEQFEEQRNKSLFERSWLDRLIAATEVKTLLDVGCGPGLPVARYLVENNISVTGVDGSPAMIELFTKNIPTAEGLVCDMRELDLGEQFDAVLVLDSFFFLSKEQQRTTFPRLAAHVRTGGALLINTGPEDAEGESWAVKGAPAYHASLSPREYRELFKASGLRVLEFSPNDPGTGRTMWLARREG